MLIVGKEDGTMTGETVIGDVVTGIAMIGRAVGKAMDAGGATGAVV